MQDLATRIGGGAVRCVGGVRDLLDRVPSVLGGVDDGLGFGF